MFPVIKHWKSDPAWIKHQHKQNSLTIHVCCKNRESPDRLNSKMSPIHTSLTRLITTENPTLIKLEQLPCCIRVTHFLFCPCAEPPAALVLMRGWRFPSSLSSLPTSLHIFFQTSSRIWRMKRKTREKKGDKWGDSPTWVMTHCTLCSSSWTDISSSLSQHSISGCGSHPLSSPSLSLSHPLSLPLSLCRHTSFRHPSFTRQQLLLSIPIFSSNFFSLRLSQLLPLLSSSLFFDFSYVKNLLSFIPAPSNPNNHKNPRGWWWHHSQSVSKILSLSARQRWNIQDSQSGNKTPSSSVSQVVNEIARQCQTDNKQYSQPVSQSLTKRDN